MVRIMRTIGATLVGGTATAFFVRKYYLGIQDKELWELGTQVEPQISDVPDGWQLKCVQIFFRHGARTPLKHIPQIEEVRAAASGGARGLGSS